MFQHQQLTQVKGEGAVGVGSALSTSTDSCKEREHRRCAFAAWLCYAFRAFSLRQAAAARSPSAPCSAQHSWSNPADAGGTVFLDLTSTPSRNRNSMLKEFLCLISRFQELFCTLLYSETIDTSCSSWACCLCLFSLSACPPLPAPPRGERYVAWGLASD